MAKYHKTTYDVVAAGDLTRPGVRLAAACIDAEIPVQVVAKWIGVSRQAVYYWLTGATDVARRHIDKVERITDVLLDALDANELPAEDLETALAVVKRYRSKKS